MLPRVDTTPLWRSVVANIRSLHAEASLRQFLKLSPITLNNFTGIVETTRSHEYDGGYFDSSLNLLSSSFCARVSDLPRLVIIAEAACNALSKRRCSIRSRLPHEKDLMYLGW